MRMKVTPQQIAERYAAMSDEELKSLDPRKLTAGAAALREEELKRRGVADSPGQEERRAAREAALEAARRKNHARQLAAVALAAAALFMEFVAARFADIPRYALTAVIVALCVLALYVLRGRR